MTEPKRMKFIIYLDSLREWRWRLKASNGRILADSAEGYKNRSHAVKMVSNLITNLYKAEIKS